MTPPRFLVRRAEDFFALPAFQPASPRLLARLVAMILARRTTLVALVTFLRFVLPAWPRILGGHGARALANERYYGVHTFWLTKGDESTRGMRYHWRPVGIDMARRRPTSQDLAAQLEAQLRGGSTLSFDLVVDVLDENPPARKLDDPLRWWPGWIRDWPGFRRRRRWFGTTRYVAGRLTLNEFHQDHVANHQWVFDPVPMIEGLAATRDEILHARSGAYRASHVRRSTS